ncbi:attachment p12 family protein [Rhodovulum imhoffii]|uniref:Attachment p12 family protein n=1 Tax=Rhodovulum imhoffii TaxID=365340 RepID=A0A2T5BRL2_9RHOB|nr:FeoB-associated Cys-rich membrane protein [Rhodovulum imhoffii]MBK5934474.1 hypothetical protein [Rhodovulum imhoffii]PTN01824.1 attachment p12 family protein [Rhodovulum imhoffii]
MTDTPAISLGEEAGITLLEYGLIGLALVVALGGLARGLRRRRRGAARGCAGCGGCSGGQSCPMVDLRDPSPPDKL